jgi:hypothetical protein
MIDDRRFKKAYALPCVYEDCFEKESYDVHTNGMLSR